MFHAGVSDVELDSYSHWVDVRLTIKKWSRDELAAVVGVSRTTLWRALRELDAGNECALQTRIDEALA